MSRNDIAALERLNCTIPILAEAGIAAWLDYPGFLAIQLPVGLLVIW